METMPGGSASRFSAPRLRLRHFPRLMALAFALLLIAPFALPAAVQESAAVCLVKTDRTGGKLGFAVRRKDARRFTAVGFQVVSCPVSLDRAAAGIGARCARLRRLDGHSRSFIQELYGLSPEAMCDAHDAWARSRPRPSGALSESLD